MIIIRIQCVFIPNQTLQISDGEKWECLSLVKAELGEWGNGGMGEWGNGGMGEWGNGGMGEWGEWTADPTDLTRKLPLPQAGEGWGEGR